MDLDNDELSEDELENALGGANKEVLKESIDNHKELYRPRSIKEIQREKEELLLQKEELLNNKGMSK